MQQKLDTLFSSFMVTNWYVKLEITYRQVVHKDYLVQGCIIPDKPADVEKSMADIHCL